MTIVSNVNRTTGTQAQTLIKPDKSADESGGSSIFGDKPNTNSSGDTVTLTSNDGLTSTTTVKKVENSNVKEVTVKTYRDKDGNIVKTEESFSFTQGEKGEMEINRLVTKDSNGNIISTNDKVTSHGSRWYEETRYPDKNILEHTFLIGGEWVKGTYTLDNQGRKTSGIIKYTESNKIEREEYKYDCPVAGQYTVLSYKPVDSNDTQVRGLDSVAVHSPGLIQYKGGVQMLPYIDKNADPENYARIVKNLDFADGIDDGKWHGHSIPEMIKETYGVSGVDMQEVNNLATKYNINLEDYNKRKNVKPASSSGSQSENPVNTVQDNVPVNTTQNNIFESSDINQNLNDNSSSILTNQEKQNLQDNFGSITSSIDMIDGITDNKIFGISLESLKLDTDSIVGDNIFKVLDLIDGKEDQKIFDKPIFGLSNQTTSENSIDNFDFIKQNIEQKSNITDKTTLDNIMIGIKGLYKAVLKNKEPVSAV